MKTLDIIECAEFLKINETTASELAAKGVLPGAKIGRAWVFLEDDLVQYLRMEVQKQQRQRLETTQLESVAARQQPDVVALLPALKKSQKRRNIPPPLPDFVSQVRPAQVGVAQ